MNFYSFLISFNRKSLISRVKIATLGRAVLVALSLSVSLSSCATLINGSTDTVTIVSEEENSKIFVNGQFRGWNDAIVELERGEVHHIVVSKEGCEDVTENTGEAFDSRTLLGFFMAYGILSFPVDFASGVAGAFGTYVLAMGLAFYVLLSSI